MANLFLNGANKARLGKLIEDLTNQYAMDYDNYLLDIAAASAMILGYQNKVNNPNYQPNNKKPMKEKILKKKARLLLFRRMIKRI